MRKQSNWERFCRRETQRNALYDMFSSVDYSRLHVRKATEPPDDEDLAIDDLEDENDIDDTASSATLQQAIAALILANPALTEQQAAHFLVHSPQGRAMI